MRVVSIAAVVLVALLAGCGDDGLSADEYRERLDRACGELASTMTRLPQVSRDENLDRAGIERYAQRASDRFEDTLDDLDPPDDLRDAHESLKRVGNEAPRADDITALRDWMLRIAGIYDELGAEGCAQGQRRQAEQIAAQA